MNIDMQTPSLDATLSATPDKPEWGQVWQVTRALLVVWALAIWALLILLPGLEQSINIETAMLHLPYVLIGLALVGAVVAAHSLRADRHLLWFLSVLLMLAGWM
ncbi:hypothetical protein [Thiothrix winogradskyi]|uniref:Uncharacterized protein n=1 Tax=Thiothrix winogradskyi TaxID=96472 RepID=A0ABY3T3H5_9GAMM|nr:hypothetical protein [Thiothrix winogradskyi]UJS25350.1 hypothetical protein L2Y54_04730 [Thiothrix winogradskyi]